MPFNQQVIFIGGGFDSWFSRIVRSYADEYALKNPGVRVRYYSWREAADVRLLLRTIAKEDRITVVGHSYGADTAFHAVSTRFVNTLISIDPVGRMQAKWPSVRAHCGTWLNVRAEPSERHANASDGIAREGGKYPRPPNPGQPGAPDYSLFVDEPHGEFRAMMRATWRGVSGRRLLGGVGVA